MANIPEIFIGGKNYKVKDAEARTQISDLKSTMGVHRLVIEALESQNQTVFKELNIKSGDTFKIINNTSTAVNCSINDGTPGNVLQQFSTVHAGQTLFVTATTNGKYFRTYVGGIGHSGESATIIYDRTGMQGNIKQLNEISNKYEVVSDSTGGVNVTYPMSVGDSILVTNNTPASIVVRQRDSSGTVLVATDILSGATKKIISTVNSVDIRFYFNQGGTIYFEDATLRLPTLEEKIYNVINSQDVNDFLLNYLVDSKLIFHESEYSSDTTNANVTIAEFDIDDNFKTYYLKADALSNITNPYPVGVIELDSNGNQVAINGRSQAWLLNGARIPITNRETTRVRIYTNVGERSDNKISNLFVWATRDGRIDRKPFPVFHVEKDGSGDFASLVEAINEATRYMDAIVYIGAGTWDIIDELGSDYLRNVGSEQRGLYLKNRVHLICDSQSKIVANYTGDLANVKKWLSIFNSGRYGFTLENATLEGSNIRYLIHDERDQDTDAYVNKYLNCRMEFDNRNNTEWSSKQCIGGGLGQNGYVDIEGCTFKSYQGYDGVVSYHNSAGADAKSHIVLRDCYFYLNNTFRLSWHGTSTAITEALVTGCYLGASIVHRAENSSAVVENTSIVEWNNIIKPST